MHSVAAELGELYSGSELWAREKYKWILLFSIHHLSHYLSLIKTETNAALRLKSKYIPDHFFFLIKPK